MPKVDFASLRNDYGSGLAMLMLTRQQTCRRLRVQCLCMRSEINAGRVIWS